MILANNGFYQLSNNGIWNHLYQCLHVTVHCMPSFGEGIIAALWRFVTQLTRCRGRILGTRIAADEGLTRVDTEAEYVMSLYCSMHGCVKMCLITQRLTQISVQKALFWFRISSGVALCINYWVCKRRVSPHFSSSNAMHCFHEMSQWPTQHGSLGLPTCRHVEASC